VPFPRCCSSTKDKSPNKWSAQKASAISRPVSTASRLEDRPFHLSIFKDEKIGFDFFRRSVFVVG
jgi:hypothetical protein